MKQWPKILVKLALGSSQRRRLSVHNTNSAESVLNNWSKPIVGSEPNLSINSATAVGSSPEAKTAAASETNLPIKVPKKRGRPFKVPPPSSTYQR